MNGYNQPRFISFPQQQRRPRAPPAAKPKSSKPKPLSDGQKATIAREYIESHRSVPIKFEGSEHKTHLHPTDIRNHLSNAEVSKVTATMLKGIGSMKGTMHYVSGTLLAEGKVRLTMTVGLPADLSTKMMAAMQVRAASNSHGTQPTQAASHSTIHSDSGEDEPT